MLALLALPGCGGGESAGAEADGRPRGHVLLESNGCLACHVYDGEGVQSLGAPELTHQGSRERGVEWIVDYIRSPKDANDAALMPAYKGLADEDVRAMAEFLETSK